MPKTNLSFTNDQLLVIKFALLRYYQLHRGDSKYSVELELLDQVENIIMVALEKNGSN